MSEFEVSSPVAPRAAAPFFWSFGVSVVIAIAALLTLRLTTLPAGVLEEQRRWVMDVLPSDEIAALKLSHAQQAAPYDVGLFGNSRIVMVGALELGLGERRVFNFGVPGQSIRQSIALIEELRAHGKLPNTVVISMDHAELGLQGGAAVYPGPPRRWRRAAIDLWIVWTRDGWRAALVQIINTVAAESRELAITFNHSFVITKARALAGMIDRRSAYRADGSRFEKDPLGDAVIAHLPRRAERYPQLEFDFGRLEAIRRSGVRVVIYESPVAPQLTRPDDQGLSDNARDVRQRFHMACTHFQFECYGPPLLDSRKWFDRDHAPVDALAGWLRMIIDSKR